MRREAGASRCCFVGEPSCLGGRCWRCRVAAALLRAEKKPAVRREMPEVLGSHCASRWLLRFFGRRKTLKIEKEAVRGKWQAEKTPKMKKEAV